ncbi:MAG: helix-turn-helix transcriptional regulator [Bacilli bacterium]|nr:helix-turn-helix transcriptional regulator [Bacilli bacterium]
MKKAIGNELKLTRLRNDLSLDDVAEAFDVNKETIRRYEKNSIGLTVERLEKLLNFYKCDKNIFFANICEYMHKN